MSNLMRITAITIKDLMRQKSFYILLGVALLFLLLLRSCYHGNYVINGRPVDQASLAFHASVIAFHVVAAAMFLMTALLSMGIISRDREDGSMVMFLARAVDRWQYVLGRVAGTWVLATLFMLTLHLTIALIGLANTGQLTPEYLTASLLCSLNLLFAIVLTCALSLFLPNVVAGLFSLIIIGVGFVSDGAYQVMRHEAVRQFIPEEGPTATWRIIYPKVYLLQDYAATWISHRAGEAMPPLYVVANVLAFTVLLAAAALWRFYQSEI